MNIISLSFFNDIWIHSYPEFLFYKNLKEKYGVNIDVINCEKVFSKNCPAHNNKSILLSDTQAKKNKICNSCVKTTNFYKKNSNLNHLNLSDFIKDKDKSKIKEILKKINLYNYKNLSVLGVNVSRSTLFNFLINNKLNSDSFDKQTFNKFKISLEYSLITLFAFKKILYKKKYDFLISYSTEYSLNRVCAEYAKLKNIKIMNLVAGKNPQDKYSKLILSESHKAGFVYHANLNWNKFKKKPVALKDLNSVELYIESLLKSKSYLNFSLAPKGTNIRNYFKIPSKYKKIVLVALAGAGERLGDHLIGHMQSKEKNCSTKHFDTDFQWAKYLVKNADKFQDTFFIFRPHPRDYNYRGNLNISSVMKNYVNLSKSLPDNCKFNFREDQISIYDFIPYVDLLLNSSSVTSYEFGMFGVRTLIFDPKLYYYSNDLVLYPKNFKDYSLFMQKTLDNKDYNKKKIIINAFKWLSIQFNYETIDISDVFKPNYTGRFFKALNTIQRLSGTNFMVNLFYNFTNTKMKNISLFYKMLKNNYDSPLNINLRKIYSNSTEKNEFKIVKKMILNQLYINKQNKIYEKFNKIN